MSDFAHLHLHTEHSLLDGINRIETLPEYIRDTLGQKAVAITDHGTVSGSYKFFKSCNEAGVKPIIGMEAYYAVGDRTVREADHLGQKYHHLVLLAKNNTGLHNLYKLSSESYISGMYYKPRIDDELLAQYSEGIVATSACLGSYSSQLILNGDVEAAERLLDHHKAIFGDDFFLEIQLHEDKEQQEVNRTLIEIAKRRNWPLLLTNDCHYTHPQDKMLHEEALCMQTGDVLSNDNRFSFGPIDVHVAHHDWMWEKAQALKIPYEAISNTAALASSIDSDSYYQDRKNRYPTYKGLPDGLPSWEALYELSHNLLRKKFSGSPPQEYIDRLNREYKIIKKMGFYDYLFIVREFQEGARDLGVLVGLGRGSVAGSLMAYVLEITEIDPIKHGLVFERWLNYGRAARPLVISRDMMKMIKESENGSGANTTPHRCVHGDGCDSLPSVRPSVLHVDSPPIVESPPAKEKEREIRYPQLGDNLLKCLEQGLSIKF